MPVQNHAVSGDFNGDGRQDTLVWHLFSGKTGQEIDSIPDPFVNEWYDEITTWYMYHQPDGYLAPSQAGIDTLPTAGTGLCLLQNIGDTNHDRKDELAIAFDYQDYSAVNGCDIMQYCASGWQSLLHFQINENGFPYTPDTQLLAHTIQGFLEKHNGRWMYRDYNDWMNAETPRDTLFRPLRLEKCR
jgi:hypothetical protein